MLGNRTTTFECAENVVSLWLAPFSGHSNESPNRRQIVMKELVRVLNVLRKKHRAESDLAERALNKWCLAIDEGWSDIDLLAREYHRAFYRADGIFQAMLEVERMMVEA